MKNSTNLSKRSLQNIKSVLLLLFISCFFIYAKSQPLNITATVINGTCFNNGQINVLATGGTAPYRFRLIAGPAGLNYPTFYQTGTNYSSLKPGTYSVQVIDATNNTDTTIKTVTTSYISLNINSVNITADHCPALPDGTVKMKVTAGKTPYSYALLSGSTTVRAPQASNTFTGVASGTYTSQVTDACGEIRSYSTIVPLLDWSFLSAVKTQDNNFFGSGGGTSIVPAPFDTTKYLASGAGPLLFTCDSISARFSNFMLQNQSNIAPRRIWVKDLNTGVIIFDQTYTPANTYRQASSTVKMKINTNYRIYYSDLCNDFDSTDRNYSTQTSYNIHGSPLKLCSGNVLNISWTNDYNTKNKYSCPSDTITIIGSSLAGDTTIGKFSIHDKLAGNSWTGYIPGIIPGNTYTMRVNTCCSSYIKSQYIGMPTATASTLFLRDQACKINTASYIINTNYLAITPGYFTYSITSGPASFTDNNGNVFNITYPIKDSTLLSGTQNNIYIRNFPEGNYTIDVRDQCGSMQTLNLAVTQTSLAKLTASLLVNTQCSGGSSITLNGTYQHVAGQIVLYKKSTGGVYNILAGSSVFATTAEIPASYTFPGLADGDYRVAIIPVGTSGQTYGVNSPVNACDSLFVQDVNITYQLPASSTIGFVCTPGSNDGRVIVSGSNGARPFIYQRLSMADNSIIITQSDSIFSGLGKGTYRFRIIDNCGNGIIHDVSIDTLFKPTFSSMGSFCVGTNATISSPGLTPDATFLWTGPNGYSSLNDTIFFNPVTASDLGEYTLTQTIPGCDYKKDSVTVTINSCEIVPVTLAKFMGIVTNNCGTVKLEWQTSTELNLREFQVQQSNDQANFKSIAIKPALNIISGSNYSVTATQNDKNVFYRLATIDLNGKRSYSNIIKVTQDCKIVSDYIVIYPNPASSIEKVIAEIKSSKEVSASIILHAEDGRQVQAQSIRLTAGINKVVIKTKNLAPGVYTVTLTDDTKGKAKKVKLVIN